MLFGGFDDDLAYDEWADYLAEDGINPFENNPIKGEIEEEKEKSSYVIF